MIRGGIRLEAACFDKVEAPVGIAMGAKNTHKLGWRAVPGVRRHLVRGGGWIRCREKPEILRVLLEVCNGVVELLSFALLALLPPRDYRSGEMWCNPGFNGIPSTLFGKAMCDPFLHLAEACPTFFARGCCCT